MARGVVRPMIGTGVTPNHLTTLRLLTGIAACAALAAGPNVHGAMLWGGLLWVLSAFLDRMDGELARVGNMMSPGGHRYDYMVDNGVNCLFFLAIGVGLRHATLLGHQLGLWTILMGVAASAALMLCNWMSERYEQRLPGERTWSGACGFHPDDALYLLGPAAWLGWLLPILVASDAATSVMALVILVRLRLLIRRQDSVRDGVRVPGTAASASAATR